MPLVVDVQDPEHAEIHAKEMEKRQTAKRESLKDAWRDRLRISGNLTVRQRLLPQTDSFLTGYAVQNPPNYVCTYVIRPDMILLSRHKEATTPGRIYICTVAENPAREATV